jgi:membrane fusion protein
MVTDERRSEEGVALRTSGTRRGTPLFRHQVLDARREKALGDVLLIQPLSTRLLTVVAIGLAGALVAFGFWGEYTRKARVSGFLVPTSGLIKVYSRELGTIVEKRVAEGQPVSKGDVLYVISMERRSTGAVDTQGAAMDELGQRRTSLNTQLKQQQRIAAIEEDSLGQRIASLQGELARLALEVDIQQQRVASTRTSVERFQTLAARGLASQEMVEGKRRELLEEEGRLHIGERSRIALTQQIDGVQAQIRSLRLKTQTEQQATRRSMSQITQELTEYEARRTFVVTSPADGTATAVLAELGQTANPGLPLLSLLPANAELAAHLIVPSQSIGFLERDQTVALRYHAFPYQRFGSYHARISEISRTLIMPNEAALPIALKEPAYRVTVTLDSQVVKAYGQDLPLKAGMLFDADVWLDRRKLYEWVLEPLYSVLGRV